MRKVIDTSNLAWDDAEVFEQLFNVRKLPKFIIIETVEEEE